MKVIHIYRCFSIVITYLCERHLRVAIECVLRDFEGLENNGGDDAGNLIPSSLLAKLSVFGSE